jgi:hypothetical protein
LGKKSSSYPIWVAQRFSAAIIAMFSIVASAADINPRTQKVVLERPPKA